MSDVSSMKSPRRPGSVGDTEASEVKNIRERLASLGGKLDRYATSKQEGLSKGFKKGCAEVQHNVGSMLSIANSANGKTKDFLTHYDRATTLLYQQANSHTNDRNHPAHKLLDELILVGQGMVSAFPETDVTRRDVYAELASRLG